jgi:preprotein translocase SecE subunit
MRETGQEMKRVSWPGRDELKESTIVVLVTVSVITVFLFFVDKILDLSVKGIIKSLG